MLPVIQYNREKWEKNVGTCLQCGQLDTRAGLCSIGTDHQSHINSGYCPQGDFGPGSDERPEVWPVQEHARIMVCRACPAFVNNFCGDDGASVREHARQGICPQGKYADGTTGRIEKAQTQSVDQVQSVASGRCCG
jgi:hypothetical protein